MTRFYLAALARNMISFKFASALLSAFGALWLVVEISAFFFAGSPFALTLPSLWPVFFAIGVVTGAIIAWPKARACAKLNGRDVSVELAIGDIMQLRGALIIGSNTTFDTQLSEHLISLRSVQGQFTREYYGTDETQLNAEIQVSLNNVRFQQLPPNRRGNSRRYPVGTVVRVNHPQKAAYFVAIADINEHGVASGSLDSVKDALASLWTYVGTRGLKEPLLIPVLGTGFTRLPESRELIIREIIKSFVAACADKVFSDKLTIVIHPKDLANHQIAFDMLASYLKHICTYTEFPPIATPRTGIPEDQPVPLLGTPPAQMPNAAT